MGVFLKTMFFYVLKLLLVPLRILPVKKNRILFTGLTGGKTNEYSCNLKYLCEYLEEKEPGRFEICWAVSEPENYRFLQEKGYKVVKHFTLGSFPVLMTAKVIVSNGAYAPWFPFRKSQYFINTWHGGGAYKKIENNKPDANWFTRKRAQICADNISLFVSTCKAASEKLFRGAFLYKGEIIEQGMPRNDKIVRQETEEQAAKVKKEYGLSPEDKIVLFAPTYRPEAAVITLDADKLLECLGQDGKHWYFMRRAHRYQNGYQIQVTGKKILEAGDYPDMQELLCAADVLITDYSSCIWEYSFLYRPCFLYTPDLDSYIKNTGFYTDIYEWPFPLCRTEEELYEKIEHYDENENRAKIQAHHQALGSCESGRACEALTERIKQVTGVK